MQSYPLHTHNVVLFLVSRWKQTFGVRRVVSVADRTWENIDLTFSSLWVRNSILITSTFGNCYDDSLHLGIISLWLDYLWIIFESSLNSFMHDYYCFLYLFDLLIWFGQLYWFILQWERCFVMGSVLRWSISQWKKGTRHVFILLPLIIKQWGLFILIEFTLSTSCHLG